MDLGGLPHFHSDIQYCVYLSGPNQFAFLVLKLYLCPGEKGLKPMSEGERLKENYNFNFPAKATSILLVYRTTH